MEEFIRDSEGQQQYYPRIKSKCVEGLIWGINEMVQGPYAHVVLP
jgi:hypothetical protein